jgi:hypothetical protein
VLFSCLDAKSTLGGKQHYLLYALTPAMKPRMLMTGAPGVPAVAWERGSNMALGTLAALFFARLLLFHQNLM